MIDDMEDGDQLICVRDGPNGRHGPWVIVADGSSMSKVTPAQGAFAPTLIDGGRGASSRYAAHFEGSGFTDWGALMGFTLNNDQGLFSTYKASTYGGITFWMKSNAAVSVNFRLPTTSLVGLGGACEDSASTFNCNNNFQFRISAPLEPNDWVEYHVPFAALAQGTGGHPRTPLFGDATWNADLLVGIEFDVGPGSDFDVWIDDVAFYQCTYTDCLPTPCPASTPQSCPAKGLSPAACWSDATNCFAIPTCTNSVAPIGCPANGTLPAGCGAPETDCSTVHDFGVWGSAANDVWTAGSRGTIAHWTGSDWTFPRSNTTEDLFGVWGSAANDVWAVGVRGAIVHWNGSAWTPSRSDTASHLSGVWGNGLGDVWAVGAGGVIIHWDGVQWDGSASNKGVSGTAQDLLAVWGSGLQKDVWAVGAAGTIVHYQDGSSWSAEDSGTTEALIGVWGTSADDVWAVGHLGTIVHRDSSQRWSPRKSNVTQTLHGIWGTGPKDLWIVGDNVILHGDGDTWVADQAGSGHLLQGVWGPGSNDTWAVGFANTVLHWDGSTWMERHP